jgi:hypothetical protein
VDDTRRRTLHYTLATGDIASKSATAAYVATTFPDWSDLDLSALPWRQQQAERVFTTSDARAAAALIDAVVTDAWQQYGVSDSH